MATVFISYNRESETTTKALAEDIEALGHTVWFDKNVSGGQAWWDQILDRIRQSEVFVFVLDTKALNSTACKREYGYATDLGKPILPILASNDVSTNLLPPALSKIQFIDYRNADREAAFRLARAFTTIPPSKTLPDPLPSPPGAPISYLGNLAEQVDTSAVLNYEQQSAILLDLRRGLRDPNTANDVNSLLKKFRKRKDLLASIAEEVDNLIKDNIKTVSRVSELKKKTTPVPHPPELKLNRKKRVTGLFTLVLAALAIHTATWTYYLIDINAQYIVDNIPVQINLFSFYIMILSGAIAGAICGKDIRGICFSFIGLLIFPCWAGLFIDAKTMFHYPQVFPVYIAAIIAGIMAIVGSLFGIYISNRKALKTTTV